MSELLVPDKKPETFLERVWAVLGRVIVAVAVPAITFYVLYLGFIFLRDSGAPQAVIAVVAIVWGVGGVAALFFVMNWIIQHLPIPWRKRFIPFLFVGPALIILGWYLAAPVVRSLVLSFMSKTSEKFVGLENYLYVFTNRTMLIAFRNMIWWLVIGTGLCVLFGLIIAILVDRLRNRSESTAKSFIFLPMAISFIGAGIIWKFVYAFRPVSVNQIGLLNAMIVASGGDPVNFITNRPWNTFYLIFILVWMQTGFAMVVLSAGIKGVPKTLYEAARIDGAKEFRIILQIVIPYIKSTIITVTTAILLITLKIFDIVYAMTNGLYGTEVLASQQFKQMFKFLHYGRGSAIAIVFLLAVSPVIWYNLKQFGQREVF